MKHIVFILTVILSSYSYAKSYSENTKLYEELIKNQFDELKSFILKSEKSNFIGSTFSPENIYEDYTNNELSANKKYKNKYVRIKVKVDRIQEDISGDAFLSSDIPEQFSSVAFYVKDVNDEILSLKKGDVVDLMCMGNGMVLGNPMFRNCLFTKDYLDLSFKKAIDNIKAQKLSSKVELIVPATAKSILGKCDKSPNLCDNKSPKDFGVEPDDDILKNVVEEFGQDKFKSLPNIPALD